MISNYIQYNKFQHQGQEFWFQLDSSVISICKVLKELIVEVLVVNKDLYLGYESIQKLQQYFTQEVKQDAIMKKYGEIFLTLEDFLLTREINTQKLTLQIKQNMMSSKKFADTEVYNKFIHVKPSLEKNLIANIPIKNYQKVQIQLEKQEEFIIYVLQNSNFNKKKHKEKNQEEQAQLQPHQNTLKNKINQKKQLFQNQNKKLNFYYAFNLKTNPQKKKSGQSPLKRATQFSQAKLNQKNKERKQYIGISSNQIQEVLLNNNKQLMQTQSQQNGQMNQDLNYIFDQQQKQNFQNLQQGLNGEIDLLGMEDPSILIYPTKPNHSPPQLHQLEKIIIAQQDGIIKDSKIYGQILIEGYFPQDIIQLDLIGNNWNSPDAPINRRKTPNSLPVKEHSNQAFKVKVDSQSFESPKGIIDYIIPSKKYFNASQIPLFFTYKQETHPQRPDTRFFLQYQVNESWTSDINDVEIQVFLNKNLQFSDIKTQPQATSYQNKIVTWHAKKLNPNVKGKLGLVLEGINQSPKWTLDYIKISLKSQLDLGDLKSSININNQQIINDKKLVIEYKILQNIDG